MADCLKRRGDGDDDAHDGSNFFSRLLRGVGTDGSGNASTSGKNRQQVRVVDLERDGLTKQLAAKLDLDAVGKTFRRFAGADEVMDIREFDSFTKSHKLTPQMAESLWRLLDKDGSGEISRSEFTRVDALLPRLHLCELMRLLP